MVYIPYNIYLAIYAMRYHHSNLEFSLIWKVEDIDWKITITDIYIPKQTNNNKTRTEIDDIEAMYEDLAEAWVTDTGKWKLRFHSHNTMIAFWSWQDSSNREYMASKVFFDEYKGFWWSLSIVMWKWATFHATIDYHKDNKTYSTDVEVVVMDYDVDETLIKEYTDSIILEDSSDVFTWLPSPVITLLAEWLEKKNAKKIKKLVDKFITTEKRKEAILNEQYIDSKFHWDNFPSECIERLKEMEYDPTEKNKFSSRWFVVYSDLVEAWWDYNSITHMYYSPLDGLWYSYLTACEMLEKEYSKKYTGKLFLS